MQSEESDMKLESYVRIEIDRMAENIAAAVERARREGKPEGELRQELDLCSQKFRAMWAGKMTEVYLDMMLSELATAIARHRAVMPRRVN